MKEKEIYSQELKQKNSVGLRVLAFGLLVAILALLLFIASSLPYSGITTLVVIFLFAVLTLKLSNTFIFDITYVLYEDRLVFVRRYGKLSWENEVFYFNEAEFYEDKIVSGKSTYPFYPDEKLKSLILEQK